MGESDRKPIPKNAGLQELREFLYDIINRGYVEETHNGRSFILELSSEEEDDNAEEPLAITNISRFLNGETLLNSHVKRCECCYCDELSPRDELIPGDETDDYEEGLWCDYCYDTYYTPSKENSSDEDEDE